MTQVVIARATLTAAPGEHGRVGRDDYGLEASERTNAARLTVAMVCCDRPLSLRADVIALPDGRLAMDAESLRLAVGIHVSRCGGR